MAAEEEANGNGLRAELLRFPEPQFAREAFFLLDGEWEVSLGGKPYRAIRVPYCVESELSGIGETGFVYELRYRKAFAAPQHKKDERVLLHFGAVDRTAEVYVNGVPAGSHSGGYTPFSFDVTDLLREGENVLEVAVHDDVHENFPSGKQSAQEQSYGCMYTRVTGIWQSVWLECVPRERLLSVRFYPSAERCWVRMEVTAQTEGEFRAEIAYGGKIVGECGGHLNWRGAFEAKLSEKHLWELGAGRLYQVRLQFGEDTVYSYFGLRDVRYEGKTFLLNGKPVFQRLVLDQGYYPEGIYTPRSEDDLVRDIGLGLRLGFNGARLHQKVFDPKVLYLCDVYGYMTWGEYPSWGMRVRNLEALGAFLGEWREAVERDFNHPCIVMWCPLNEMWSDPEDERLVRDVRFADAAYAFTKALDPTRPCVDVSGGLHGHKTDVADFHFYGAFEKLKAHMESALRGAPSFDKMYQPGEGIGYKGEPLHLSEFGGVRFGTSEGGWGYENDRKEEEFVARYEKTAAYLLGCGQLSGFCYTQLYDVEQEQNGLYYYDRRPKLYERGMRRIRAANTAAAACETDEEKA